MLPYSTNIERRNDFMKSKQALWLLCVSAVLGLSACGGKGGEEQAPAPPQPLIAQPL